ncbi:pyridoxamine 5'-phosphate oxidase family protein [Salsipaludibacter albus]|uniref:pyridoxamine 5'-phosphate oxidase family protein n=1 Tax=Salsipaludibacter albus TaxID=2849650 RepID=UPI001EE3D210|nr:pyridoxamine 5'-phosphate oxidase family protein [Salsipaludibacter albus]MBY5160993.1 pyridoxamine 5'-phosphate oxidase family protein [Salsipaludibacter albus]
MADEPTPTMQHAMEDPPRDRLGMTVLDEDRCWELVRGEPLGRLAVVVDGRPHLVPINHVVRDREVLFVSVPGTKLHRALHQPGGPAVFEVDGYDADDHSGWSVIVSGHLHPVQDLVEHTGLDLRGRPIWLDGYRDRSWLRLVPEHVNGRTLDQPD